MRRLLILSVCASLAAVSTACTSATESGEPDSAEGQLVSCSNFNVASSFKTENYGPVIEAIQGATVLKNGNIAITTTVDSYTLGQDPSVYVLDKDLKKVAAFKADHRQRLLTAPVELKDGSLVATSLEGTVYFVGADGTAKARFDSHETISSAVTIVDADTVAFGTYEGSIFFIDTKGNLKQKATGKSKFDNAGAVAKDGTVVFAGNFEVMFLKPDGTVKKIVTTDNTDVRGVAARSDGTVIVLSVGIRGAMIYDTLGNVVKQTGIRGDSMTVLSDDSFVVAGVDLTFVTAALGVGASHAGVRSVHFSKPIVSGGNVVAYAENTENGEEHLNAFDLKGKQTHDFRSYNLGEPLAAIGPKGLLVVNRHEGSNTISLASCF